jgi:hypothetical protein
MEKQCYDGDRKILYSECFNLTQNILKIVNIIGDFTLEFRFKTEEGSEPILRPIKGGEKEFIFEVVNFNNPLGTVTASTVKIAREDSSNKNISFSLYASSIGEELPLRQVILTLYEE